MKHAVLLILITCMGALLCMPAAAEPPSGSMMLEEAVLSIQSDTEERAIFEMIGMPSQIFEATPVMYRKILYKDYWFAGYKGDLRVLYGSDNTTLTSVYWVYFRKPEKNGMETYQYFVKYLEKQLGKPVKDFKQEYPTETEYTTRWDDYAMIYNIQIDKENDYEKESYHFYKFLFDMP